MTIRSCKKCQRKFPATSEYFKKSPKCTGGISFTCNGCIKKQAQAYYKANREQVLKNTKKWRAQHAQKALAAQRVRRARFTDAQKELRRQYARDYRAAHLEQQRRLTREGQKKLRAEFIAAYGSKCACCGERESAFLTLEHKNRDGKAHRNRVGGAWSILYDLKKRKWPKGDYELLCFNCNHASWKLGTCPHRSK